MIGRFGAGVWNFFAILLRWFPGVKRPNRLNLKSMIMVVRLSPSQYQGKQEPTFIDTIATLFGLTIPYHIIDKNMGRNYGKGEIGIFLVISIIISVVLITFTGINVVVIGGTFFYFLFKTFLGLKDVATGKDKRK